MLERILEKEVLDTEQDAAEYEALPNAAVNLDFALNALSHGPGAHHALDLGTGPAHIAILLAQRSPGLHVTAVDLAEQMLVLARRNVAREKLEKQVLLLARDVKATGFPAASFDLIISNSVVHHIPEPLDFFAEVRRVSRPNAVLFVRDLLRPSSESELDDLVERYAGDCTPYQRRLYADSLHAALTVEEVRAFCAQAGLEAAVTQTSDRHWTLARTSRSA